MKTKLKGSRRPVVRNLLRRTLPDRLWNRAARRYRGLTARPPVGWIRYGSLRRLTPISRNFGFDRGVPIDRYYVEDFLRRQMGAEAYTTGAIRGCVLEIGEARYSPQFGDRAQIERIDVLDPSHGNPRANVIADLTDAPEIESSTYDCVICTQTLLLIYDVPAAVRTLHRILKPGGTVLVTVPGISNVCRTEMDTWGDFWRFTSLSARRLFEEVFEPADVVVEAYGNVLTATAFLYGLAAEDLRKDELEARDPDYEVLIAVKAVKSSPSR